MSRTVPLRRNIATTYNTYSLNTFSWSTDISGFQREFYKGIHYSVNIDSSMMFTSVELIWSKEGNLCKKPFTDLCVLKKSGQTEFGGGGG